MRMAMPDSRAVATMASMRTPPAGPSLSQPLSTASCREPLSQYSMMILRYRQYNQEAQYIRMRRHRGLSVRCVEQSLEVNGPTMPKTYSQT